VINHVFLEKPVHIFSNGRAFAITAEIALDRTQITWRVPGDLKEPLQERVAQVEPDMLDDPDTLAGHSRWLEGLLGLANRAVAWTLAVGYSYPLEVVALLPDEPAVFNRDCESDPDILQGLRPQASVDRFRNLPFYACVFCGTAIISECFHSGNGAVTVRTDERYQNRGYASSCLRVVTDRTLKAGIAPGFGTRFDSVAARALAERCGYVLRGLSYWVEIPGKDYAQLPPKVRSSLER